MLTTNNTALVLVDVQGKLARLMDGKEALFQNLRKLVQGAHVLQLPILWLEQNPAGLGPTIPELAELLQGETPIPKLSFSGCGAEGFLVKLRATGRRQVLVAGIEAHVCVYQTAADLLKLGYEVEVVADAVSSRSVENKRIALEKIQRLGARLTSVEMALFEMLGKAEGPAFKEMLQIVK
jgi:nicotinamidase-related amidase